MASWAARSPPPPPLPPPCPRRQRACRAALARRLRCPSPPLSVFCPRRKHWRSLKRRMRMRRQRGQWLTLRRLWRSSGRRCSRPERSAACPCVATAKPATPRSPTASSPASLAPPSRPGSSSAARRSPGRRHPSAVMVLRRRRRGREASVLSCMSRCRRRRHRPSWRQRRRRCLRIKLPMLVRPRGVVRRWRRTPLDTWKRCLQNRRQCQCRLHLAPRSLWTPPPASLCRCVRCPGRRPALHP
mmetsp:Transcript_47113/g.119244  ORF Transcript_47113/g.119244 Transcript_47113/m.119244 type:complete len:243 (-) Transcript_47113:691-1419(-)